MKIKNLLLGAVGFIVGTVFGIYKMLKVMVQMEGVLRAFKEDLVDKFEYLLFGYNSRKTRPLRRPKYTDYYNETRYNRYKPKETWYQDKEDKNGSDV